MLYNPAGREPMTQARLSPATKLIYGSGDTGISLTSTIIGMYFSFFLTNTVGLSPAVAALPIWLGRIWDLANDPFIGYISDRTRTRWGRRRPFLLFGALPFALCFTILWWRPPLTGALLVGYYVVAFLLYDTAATFVYMPFYALTPELTGNYDERTSLTTYRMFFSIVASLAAIGIPNAIMGTFTPEKAGTMLQMCAVFAVASALPLVLVFFGVREKKEFSEAERPRPLKTLHAVLQNKPLRLSLGIYLFTWVVMDLMLFILMYYISYCVRRGEQSTFIMLALFITAILVLPFWNWISKKFSKRTAYIFGVAFWAVVQLALITLGPGTSLEVIIALCLLAGIGVGAAHVLPWSILPDAVEWDEWKTGERHEGSFYAFVTLAQKSASAIAVPLALVLLEVFGYKAGGVADQPASAVFAIRLITGPIPAVFLGLGILCAALYPVTRPMHQAILRDLEARRAGKKPN
jgi:GPH family glycoside/pentoside/hexuronide:cation symporter